MKLSNFLPWGLIAVIGLGAGCASRQEVLQKKLASLTSEPNAVQLIRENARVTGSLEAWGRAATIDGFALATENSPQMGKYVVEQQQQLKLGPRIEVTLTSRDPEGTTMEHLRKDGTVEMMLLGGVEPVPVSDPETLRGAGLKLRLLALALGGPVGLLQDGYRIHYGGQERKGGRLTYQLELTPLPRVQRNGIAKPLDWISPPVLKDPDWLGDRLLVWIDAQSMRIDRLWVRYRLPNGDYGYLAVNVQRYQKYPGGYSLPSFLEFVRSDEYQQFSETPILTMEYQQLSVEQIN